MDTKYGLESSLPASEKSNDFGDSKKSSVHSFSNSFSTNGSNFISQNSLAGTSGEDVSECGNTTAEFEEEDGIRPKKMAKGTASAALGLNNTANASSAADSQTAGRRASAVHKQSPATSNSGKRRSTQLRPDNEDDSSMNSLMNASSNSQDSNSANCLKVPPLRIVISSSSSRSNGKETASQSASEIVSTHTASNTSNSLISARNYVVSSANFDESSDNSRSANSLTGNSTGISSNEQVNSQGRVTRSQRAAAQHLTSGTDDSNSRGSPGEVESNEATATDFSNRSENKESNKENKEQQRRRKGRQRASIGNTSTANSSTSNACTTNQTEGAVEEDTDSMSSSNSAPGSANGGANGPGSTASNSSSLPLPTYNCLHLYQSIRRQVDKRRQSLCERSISPKTPQDFPTYLLATGRYNLHGSSELLNHTNDLAEVDAILSEQLLSEEQLRTVLESQSRERQQLRAQHQVEKEKVRLAAEQEILRVHGRAALALANRSQPLSFATILRDEEVYNAFDSEVDDKCLELLSVGANGSSAVSNLSGRDANGTSSRNEYSRATYSCTGNGALADLFALTGNSEDIGARCRFSGRLLHSWLQDVQHKWNKIRRDTLYRQRREAESLHASQKLQWQWTVGELNRPVSRRSDSNWVNRLQDDRLIPIVEVTEDFEISA